MNKKELYKLLIEHYKHLEKQGLTHNQELADFIVEQESVYNSSLELHKEYRGFLKTQLENENFFKKKFQEIRNKCCHPKENYHADPSGNSDSYYECSICGKQR